MTLAAVVIPVWMYVTILVGVAGCGFIIGWEVRGRRRR